MQMNQLRIGDKLIWNVKEFDMVRPTIEPCVVVKINTEDDYAIAETSDGQGLYIDDDTIYQFKKA